MRDEPNANVVFTVAINPPRKLAPATARTSSPGSRSGSGRPTSTWLDALEHGAGAEAAAAAHRHQPELPVDALELVQRSRDQPRAGRTHRVAEGDRAPVRVDPRHVQLHLAFPREDDRCERL